MIDQLRAIPSDICKGTKNIYKISIHFLINIVFKDPDKKVSQIWLLDRLQVSVIYRQISDCESDRPQQFEMFDIFWGIQPLYEPKNRLNDMRILHEEERSFCVNAV